MQQLPDIGIAIVTALPVEAHAVHLTLDDAGGHWLQEDPNYYRVGAVPSLVSDQPHRVVVAQQTRDGTRDAAVICADLARSFPSLRTFVMCGIAGGVPGPEDAEQGVRLGDIVVATEGVVDYDHVRSTDGTTTLRRSVSPPSAALLGVENQLHVTELSGERPWLGVIERLGATALFARPARNTDALDIGGQRRPYSEPRVHRGAIGSADRLLRDAVLRDELAARFGIKAVEMEASGVATAAELHERSWFMVRGVADYCDNRSKNDVWHPYAAMVAAAYVRCLLNYCRPITAPAAAAVPMHSQPTGALGALRAVVDALLSLPQMNEEPNRRALIRQLPGYIRNAIPENTSPRLHVVNIVQTCKPFPDGRDSLINGLGVTVGVDSPEFMRVESIIREHWSGV